MDSQIALTREYLDDLKCGIPGCTNCTHELYLHPMCHLKSATTVAYNKRYGNMVVRCTECGRIVTIIAVAER